MSKVGGTRGVFERPAGSGVWWVRYVDADGKLRRKKVGKHQSAVAVYQRFKVAVREERLGLTPKPVPPPPPVPTVDQAVDDMLHRSKHLRSLGLYKRAGDVWKEAFGRRPLDSLTPGDLERWRADHLDEWSTATINRYLAILRRIFSLAIGDGLVATSPFNKGTASVKLAKENNERVRYLTEDEEERLRKVMDPIDWLAVAFAILTGLRQGEQFTARWEHIDFANADLLVPRSKHGELRHVVLSPSAVDVLRKLQQRAGVSPWVFPSETGVTPADAQNFQNRIFRPALLDAGIKDFRWHDLRHTHASRLAMDDVPLNAIQTLLGHSDPRMTARYAHLSRKYLRAAVSRVRVSTGEAPDTTADTAVQASAES